MDETVTLHFTGNLYNLLAKTHRNKSIMSSLDQNRSIKDLVESYGVPHTEIDAILVNGQPVDFSYHVQNNDVIIIYPAGQTLDNPDLTPLQPDLPDDIKFIADTHLGKLARYLRLCGFDTLYQNNYDDITLANHSSDENQILLTRDKKLLMRKQVIHGYFVRHTEPDQQLIEVLQRFHLQHQLKPFTRCMTCNGYLQPVAKVTIDQQLEENTRRYFNAFWQCAKCHQIYWKGSHYDNMLKLVGKLQKN